MFRFIRRMVCITLAISLFVFSASFAFAVDVSFEGFYPSFTNFTLQSGSYIFNSELYKPLSGADGFSYPPGGSVLSYEASLPSVTFDGSFLFNLFNIGVNMTNGSSTFNYYPLGCNAGYYTTTFSFRSSNPLPDDFALVLYSYYNGTQPSALSESDFSYSYSSQSVLGSNDFLNIVTISYALSLNTNNFGLQFTFINTGTITNVTKVSVANSFFRAPESSSSASLFDMIRSGFDNILGFLGVNRDKDESNYNAVTDPTTNAEIDEAQGMIDTVEGFESSLHGNINTEFDKVDFTTPTNLASPVAFVADKVTKSVNALGGGFQPLVFVPLTLGIMLIMLGRGVTALGSLAKSVSHSVSRSRSNKGGDG